MPPKKKKENANITKGVVGIVLPSPTDNKKPSILSYLKEHAEYAESDTPVVVEKLAYTARESARSGLLDDWNWIEAKRTVDSEYGDRCVSFIANSVSTTNVVNQKSLINKREPSKENNNKGTLQPLPKKSEVDLTYFKGTRNLNKQKPRPRKEQKVIFLNECVDSPQHVRSTPVSNRWLEMEGSRLFGKKLTEEEEWLDLALKESLKTAQVEQRKKQQEMLLLEELNRKATRKDLKDNHSHFVAQNRSIVDSEEEVWDSKVPLEFCNSRGHGNKEPEQLMLSSSIPPHSKDVNHKALVKNINGEENWDSPFSIGQCQSKGPKDSNHENSKNNMCESKDSLDRYKRGSTVSEKSHFNLKEGRHMPEENWDLPLNKVSSMNGAYSKSPGPATLTSRAARKVEQTSSKLREQKPKPKHQTHPKIIKTTSLKPIQENIDSKRDSNLLVAETDFGKESQGVVDLDSPFKQLSFIEVSDEEDYKSNQVQKHTDLRLTKIGQQKARKNSSQAHDGSNLVESPHTNVKSSNQDFDIFNTQDIPQLDKFSESSALPQEKKDSSGAIEPPKTTQATPLVPSESSPNISTSVVSKYLEKILVQQLVQVELERLSAIQRSEQLTAGYQQPLLTQLLSRSYLNPDLSTPSGLQDNSLSFAQPNLHGYAQRDMIDLAQQSNIIDSQSNSNQAQLNANNLVKSDIAQSHPVYTSNTTASFGGPTYQPAPCSVPEACDSDKIDTLNLKILRLQKELKKQQKLLSQTSEAEPEAEKAEVVPSQDTSAEENHSHGTKSSTDAEEVPPSPATASPVKNVLPVNACLGTNFEAPVGPQPGFDFGNLSSMGYPFLADPSMAHLMYPGHLPLNQQPIFYPVYPQSPQMPWSSTQPPPFLTPYILPVATPPFDAQWPHLPPN